MLNLLAIINEPENSGNFIRQVAKMARDVKANVRLLHVLDPAKYPLGTNSTTGAAVANLQESLEIETKKASIILGRLIHEAAKEAPADAIKQYSSEIGELTSIVNERIEKDQVDFLILESRDNENSWIHPQKNIEIIENLDCPIWIIPKHPGYKTPEHIVYATNYNHDDINTLRRLVRLVGGFSPHITVLHITDDIDFDDRIRETGFLNTVKKDIEYDRITIHTVKDGGKRNIAEIINDYAVLTKANLIVVLKENKNFLEKLIKQSMTKTILKKSELPLLVYHEKNNYSRFI